MKNGEKSVAMNAEQSVDGPKFRDDATALLEHDGCKYCIKEDLRKAS